MTTEIEKVSVKPNLAMGVTGRGIQFQSFHDWLTFAAKASETDFVPKAYYKKPEAILVAMQFGAEVGLSPMAALRSVAVINGRAALYGDGFAAVCLGSPVFDHAKYEEGIAGDGENRYGFCKCGRVGGKVFERRFSVADAKKAGLWGKTGPWTQYPDQMLILRARGFAFRSAFNDLLQGVVSFEEARDTPAEISTVAAETEGELLVAVQAPPPPKLESLADRAGRLAKGKKAASEPVAQPEPAEVATVQPEPENAPESPQPPLPGKLATTAQVNKLADLVLTMPKKVADEFKQKWNIEKAVRLTVTAWDTNRTEDCIGDAEAVLELAKG